MAERDIDRLEIAREVHERLAQVSILSPIQTRSFVRCLQETWDVEQISWDTYDSKQLLSDGWRLLHAASIIDDVEDVGDDLLEIQRQLYQRAGETLEWLARAKDETLQDAPLFLLAAGAYQLSNLPAMGSSLLASAPLEYEGEKLLAAFLSGDFDGVIECATQFWARHPDQLSGGAFEDSDGCADALSWRFTVETVRTLSLFSHSLRRGDWNRNNRSLKKLRALKTHGTRVLPPELATLMTILSLTAKRFSNRSLYRPLLAITGDHELKQKRARSYVRRQYARKRGTLWQAQLRGLRKLQQESSFALCTPTGSGKTLVANISILKELLFEHDDVFMEPLALYVVPSRALASEVETKLRFEMGSDVIVTGLYGGNDWGMTDYWLDSDKPAVLIVTVEKAEALFRNLGLLLLSRLRLLIIDEAHQVVLDQPEKASRRFARHSDRSLRLESFITRLLTLKPDVARIALTAVAGGAAEPVARWIASNSEAEPIGGQFRSTRQVIGALEIGRDRNPQLRLDLVNGIDIQVRGRMEESPYINLRIGPMPKLPAGVYSSLNRFNQLNMLWTALNLVGADQRILISIAQQPERTMKWFCDALNHKTWQNIDNFSPPETGTKAEIFGEAIATCRDYCGEDSYEYRLLRSGIATSHGQMPQRLRRLMNKLIDTGICPITIATATLTEGVNLPFDIIFVPELKRPYFDPVANRRDVQPMSASEFLNLSGRAGRPGASRNGEGMTFVAVPVSNAATAPKQQWRQTRQRTEYLRDYERLKQELIDPPELDEDLTPLAQLIDVLYTKAGELLGIDSPEAFTEWLGYVSPGDISEFAGTESEEAPAILADALDELDGILLAAIQEAQGLEENALSSSDLEAQLVKLWRTSFSALAVIQEEWLERAFIHRGSAVSTTIYPDPNERARLYAYGFPPYIGRKFEDVSQEIIEQLKLQDAYGLALPDARRLAFERIGDLLIGDRGFGFSVRSTQTEQDLMENWVVVLDWWLRIEEVAPEPDALRSWQRFVTDNLEFRLGVAIGASVAKAWNDGSDNPLQTPTLENWRDTTGLPWFAFWARELLRWGTHDPFVAFTLSQGICRTRGEAEGTRVEFAKWLNEQDNLDSEDAETHIDPRIFLKWARAVNTKDVPKRDKFSHPTELVADLKQTRYNVIPLQVGETLKWIDPAGYELARTNQDLTNLLPANLASDYVLIIKDDGDSEVFATYRRRSKN